MKKIVDLDKLDIVKLGQKTMLEDNVFSVSWILGRFCNYDCSYCWPYAKSKTVDHRPLEQYIQTMDQIKSQARANGFDRFHFSFSGGEPTAYKGLIDLIIGCRGQSPPVKQSGGGINREYRRKGYGWGFMF